MKTINDLLQSDCHIGHEIYASIDRNQVCVVETDYDRFDGPAVFLVRACASVSEAERIIACKAESLDFPASLNWEIVTN